MLLSTSFACFPQELERSSFFEQFLTEICEVRVDFVRGGEESADVLVGYAQEGSEGEGEGKEADYTGCEEEGRCGCCRDGDAHYWEGWWIGNGERVCWLRQGFDGRGSIPSLSHSMFAFGGQGKLDTCSRLNNTSVPYLRKLTS
jgi:hypothetical protein